MPTMRLTTAAWGVLIVIVLAVMYGTYLGSKQYSEGDQHLVFASEVIKTCAGALAAMFLIVRADMNNSGIKQNTEITVRTEDKADAAAKTASVAAENAHAVAEVMGQVAEKVTKVDEQTNGKLEATMRRVIKEEINSTEHVENLKDMARTCAHEVCTKMFSDRGFKDNA